MKTTFIIAFVILLSLNLPAQNYQTGDHELFIMPTAYTMEAGKSYFTDYELIFLNYTYAVTNTTHLSAFSLFPVTKDFLETLTFGVKQQYLNNEAFKAAFWATFTPKSSTATFGTVFSIGKNPDGLNLGISITNALYNLTEDLEGSDINKWEWIYMVGYRYDASKKISLIAEYENSSTLVDGKFNGFLTIGIRFRGESISWDLAGTRPLESTEDFLFFPVLKATFLID